MKAIQHFSSSTGNFYEIVANNGKRILLEIGVSWKKINQALNFDLSNIEGAFASHFHDDHFKAHKDIMRAGIDLYASPEAFAAKGIEKEHRAKILTEKTLVILDSFQVYCFGVEHDCPNTFGFVVRENDTGEYLFFATDTAFIELLFCYPFSIVMIECSYDKEILKKHVAEDTINERLASRLLDTHMEFQTTFNYLKKLDLSKCHEIHLIHCSATNLNIRKAQREISNELFIDVVTRYSKKEPVK